MNLRKNHGPLIKELIKKIEHRREWLKRLRLRTKTEVRASVKKVGDKLVPCLEYCQDSRVIEKIARQEKKAKQQLAVLKKDLEDELPKRAQVKKRVARHK